MLNRTTLTGRLTNDVDLKYTQSGTAVGSFNLAVDRAFKNKDNEREADFIRCVIWRKPAENFANFVHKGNLVGIDGRIQTRNYENQQGQRVYVTEVVVERFSLLESKNDAHQTQSGTGSNNYQGNVSTGEAEPFSNNGSSVDVSDSNLPF